MVAHKRPHIERAALQLFVKRGLRGTTVRDIATRARVAEGTLYRHWRSKRDLARSVFRDCARTVASALRHEAAGERPARDKLAAAVRALFRCARGDILLYEMLNRVAIHRRFGTLPRRLTEYARAHRRRAGEPRAAPAAEGARVMRRFTPALVGALVVAAVASTAAAPVSLREVRQSLFGTCFPTDRDGWMVGELGRIFHTSDGGTTWERQDAGTKRPFLAIACLDARTAWIAGKEGIVYGTTDGGATWTPSTTGSTRHLFGLVFANPERGHGIGDYGTMIHTEDAGTHWTVSQVPPDVVLPESALDTGVDPGDVNLYAASYGEPDHLWVAGEFGTIMASDDGGRTFHQQHAPIESTLFGIHFTDARRGWAVGIDAVILHTEDGGASWQMQTPPVRQQSFYDVFVRGQYGWIVGSAGTVLKSTDGGTTWTAEPVPIELAANWIRSVWIAPGGHGFAVGAEGLVFSIDGAELRRLQGTGPTRAL